MKTTDVLRLHERDDVAVALRDLGAGERVDVPGLGAAGLAVVERIPRGHKVALRDVSAGNAVVKLGHVIGWASGEIAAGEHVHDHNLASVRLPRGDCGSDELLQPGAIRAASPRTGSSLEFWRRQAGPPESSLPESSLPETSFLGYRRESGKVGTRNFLGVLTTVNCAATVARLVQRECEASNFAERFSHLDGVVALVHNSGCGLHPGGEALATLRRTIAGYARHANFAGVLVLGLGCETNQSSGLLAEHALSPGPRLGVLEIQQEGGTRATVATAMARLEQMARDTGSDRREVVPASHLVLALQCGGSDGFSALSANPVLGIASDLLVACGGTSILGETPEIFGAEELLLARARRPEISAELERRISWWRRHLESLGSAFDDNPSPGNKAGGLSTILEKSLGAVAKGGHAPLEGVLGYADGVPGPGLWFMDSPGNDPISVTGQIASGANLVAFTTGRGSVSGFKPAPCFKIATTSELFARLRDDMDFDAGPALRGVPTQELGAELWRQLLRVASGEQTASERLGFGDTEFVPWQPGAVL